MTFEKMCIRDRNAKIVGQSAHTIAALAGVDVPEETKILIGEVESVELSEEFAHEKLSPVLAMYHAKDFDEALDKAEKLVCDGGHGHTASLSVSYTHLAGGPERATSGCPASGHRGYLGSAWRYLLCKYEVYARQTAAHILHIIEAMAPKSKKKTKIQTGQFTNVRLRVHPADSSRTH